MPNAHWELVLENQNMSFFKQQNLIQVLKRLVMEHKTSRSCLILQHAAGTQEACKQQQIKAVLALVVLSVHYGDSSVCERERREVRGFLISPPFLGQQGQKPTLSMSGTHRGEGRGETTLLGWQTRCGFSVTLRIFITYSPCHLASSLDRTRSPRDGCDRSCLAERCRV